MSTEYLIYCQEGGKKMYLTSLPDEKNPLSGIGFQFSNDGTVPSDAGSCPTEDAANDVVAYLRGEIGTNYNRFGIEKRSVAQ